MTARPLVSIGLPVYNGAKFLPRAIDSLLAQDYENFELIISDNCSTDGSREVCERYAARDSRIRVSANPRNLGANANWLGVLANAQGDFFMWAAHDDYWRPRFISTLVRELEAHPEAAIAMSAVEFVTTEFEHMHFVKDPDPPYSAMTSFELFRMSKYQNPIVWLYLYGLFRTRFIKLVLQRPFPNTMYADAIVWPELALATRVRHVNEVLHVRTMHKLHTVERYPDEPAYEVNRRGMWTSAMNRRVVRDRIWGSSLIPFGRKVLALAWLCLSEIDLDRLRGAKVLRAVYGRITRWAG